MFFSLFVHLMVWRHFSSSQVEIFFDKERIITFPSVDVILHVLPLDSIKICDL